MYGDPLTSPFLYDVPYTDTRWGVAAPAALLSYAQEFSAPLPPRPGFYIPPGGGLVAAPAPPVAAPPAAHPLPILLLGLAALFWMNRA